MDKLYSNTNLKKILIGILEDDKNIDLTKILKELSLVEDYDNSESNVYLLALYALLNDKQLSPIESLLLSEIKNNIIFSLLRIEKVETKCEMPKKGEFTFSIYGDNGSCDKSDIPEDLEDLEAVKAYFLKKNKVLKNPNGNFVYPPVGSTAIITSGDNMTIPGVRFNLNYVIDHEGNILDIQGYPERVLERQSYEEIYQGLVNKLFANQ